MICDLLFVTLQAMFTRKMIRTTILLLAAALSAGCGNHAARSQKRVSASRSAQTAATVTPKSYTYRVRNAYPHATTSYTQGLLWHDGQLWEGTGQYGKSVIQTLDLASGRTHKLAELPRSEFGEGIAIVGGELFQLTWLSNTAHVYRLAEGRLEKIREHRYAGEGWGLTTDGEKLYFSDGSSGWTVLALNDCGPPFLTVLTIMRTPKAMTRAPTTMNRKPMADGMAPHIVIQIIPNTM